MKDILNHCINNTNNFQQLQLKAIASLWKRYLYNIENGHPQTASIVLNKIISKATVEKNTVKSSRLNLKCAGIKQKISDDSFDVVIAGLKQKQKELKNE